MKSCFLDMSVASRLVSPTLTLFALLVLSACVSNGLVFHSFGFDVRGVTPAVEVLNYKYGESKLPVYSPDWALQQGRVAQSTGVGGAMLVGEFLYVRWRIKETGEIFEDTVDLKKRLPQDIKNHKVYFDIKGPQLYVYLVTPEKRSPETQPNGPRKFQHLRVITLYPDAIQKADSIYQGETK